MEHNVGLQWPSVGDVEGLGSAQQSVADNQYWRRDKGWGRGGNLANNNTFW